MARKKQKTKHGLRVVTICERDGCARGTQRVEEHKTVSWKKIVVQQLLIIINSLLTSWQFLRHRTAMANPWPVLGTTLDGRDLLLIRVSMPE